MPISVRTFDFLDICWTDFIWLQFGDDCDSFLGKSFLKANYFSYMSAGLMRSDYLVSFFLAVRVKETLIVDFAEAYEMDV